jgi:hypothetical protein
MFMDENDPDVRVPERFSYTLRNTGRIKATVNARMTLIMPNRAAG